MNAETLREGNALAWKIEGLKKMIEETNSIKVCIETNHYCPERCEELVTPETREAITEKMAEIKQMILDDINSQIQNLSEQFEAL